MRVHMCEIYKYFLIAPHLHPYFSLLFPYWNRSLSLNLLFILLATNERHGFTSLHVHSPHSLPVWGRGWLPASACIWLYVSAVNANSVSHVYMATTLVMEPPSLSYYLYVQLHFIVFYESV